MIDPHSAVRLASSAAAFDDAPPPPVELNAASACAISAAAPRRMLAASVPAWKHVKSARSAQRRGAQAWMPASLAAVDTSVISASYSGSPSP